MDDTPTKNMHVVGYPYHHQRKNMSCLFCAAQLKALVKCQTSNWKYPGSLTNSWIIFIHFPEKWSKLVQWTSSAFYSVCQSSSMPRTCSTSPGRIIPSKGMQSQRNETTTTHIIPTRNLQANVQISNRYAYNIYIYILYNMYSIYIHMYIHTVYIYICPWVVYKSSKNGIGLCHCVSHINPFLWSGQLYVGTADSLSETIGEFWWDYNKKLQKRLGKLWYNMI